MVSSAGFQLRAGRIPGERIATTTTTTDSSTFTTIETVMDTVTAPLVAGRIYRVRWVGSIASTNADSTVLIRIRADDENGDIIQETNARLNNTLSTGLGAQAEAEFEASVSSEQTFVVTGLRNGTGTGTLNAEGASTRPRFLYVDYIRG